MSYALLSTADTQWSFVSHYDCATDDDVGALVAHCAPATEVGRSLSIVVRRMDTGRFIVTIRQSSIVRQQQ